MQISLQAVVQRLELGVDEIRIIPDKVKIIKKIIIECIEKI